MKLIYIIQIVSGIGMAEIIMLFLAIGFLLATFLAVRSLILRYWKIDEIITNQQKQTVMIQRQNELIEQQTQLIEELKAKTENNSADS